jgi:hypothetical protein
MIMKKYIYSILTMVFAGIAFSCEDTSLDPLQMDNVKKGTILALRGQQLTNIYTLGLPGAELFPRAIEGTETFDFDAEYLADDPSTLESFDIYVEKKLAGGATERVLVKTVAGSEFKSTDDYLRPWVSVSIPVTEILAAIGIPDYSDPGVPDILLTTYKFGINLSSDLNLTDGTVVPAADIVAAGLFASNQFYPAQKLTYAMTDYCPEDIGGTYSYSTVVTAVGAGGVIANCVGAQTGEGELESISRGKYSIPDVTFGQYACAWDDDPASGATLVNTCDLLEFGGADQYGLIYTIENVSVSPDGKALSFKWSNDYGDAGNTTLTRTDDKLWPLTLYSE